ncbi:MAG: N-acetylmuramoyl-L-alanine amidase family protein, partial [Turicibacter sp.]
LKSLSYDVISASDKVLTTIKPEVVEETKEYVLLEVAVPLEVIKDEYSILFTMNYKSNGIENKNAIKDFDMVTNESNNSETSMFKPTFQGQVMVLINQQKEHFEYETHNFYAESLHVSTDLAQEVQTYQLVSNGEVKIDQPYMPEANMGIDLSGLEEGQYLVQFNGLPVYTSETIYDVWYTIRREGKALQITVETHMGVLAVTVKNVLQTPDNVYDILIDPGHGGLDTGTAYLDLQEATEVLKLSKYIASRLEEHDLKVKMTRTEDLDPAGEGNFDYAESPYYNEGRVEQVYRYRANYMMSNHLNSFDKSLSGFEIYSSIISSNDWANAISNSLKSIGRVARDSEKNEFRVSEGSYKRYYACTPADVLNPKGCINPYMDFLYIIRETGGQLSQSTTLLEYNSAYKKIPNYGAETILIEYAYLDNPTDNLAWSTNWEKWAESVVKATVDYLGIPYQK